ncbi:MAG: ABC transporter ATP-binding protein/permease [Youngiibacter sp.]|nr:ABC transporter ATP-binding protein/permease [Youngiibacter sp.]
MGYLGKYFRRHYRMFFLAIIILMLETAADLTQPYLMSSLVDDGVLKSDLMHIYRQGGLMLMLTAIGAVFAFSRNIISNTVASEFAKDLRKDMFAKIQGFSMEEMDSFSRGSLVTRLTSDVTQMQNFAGGMMRIFVKAPMIFLGSLFMTWRLDRRLAMVVTAVIPIVVFLMYLNVRIGYPLFRRMQTSLDVVNDRVREYLSGVRVVKSYGSEAAEKRAFDGASGKLADDSEKAMRTMSFFSPMIALVLNLSLAAILYLGGMFHSKGEVMPGQLMAMVNYMTQLLFSIHMIGNIFNVFVRAKASHERIDEVFSSAGSEKDGKYELEGQVSSLSFNGVSFSYPEGSGICAIQDISFTVRSGETLGIIGSTGSGKTTVANLLLRLYDTEEGTIRLSDMDIKSIRLSSLRRKIAAVPQRPVLFSGTVRENMLWGKSDADDEEIRKALGLADAIGFVDSSNEGLDTRVGRGGMTLSGGQKQRISLARALIRRPDILILDDSFSKVDAVTESRIRESLKSEAEDLITILIAQKITSVMSCDRILVLDKGISVGLGTHRELLAESMEYREIYRSQIGEVEDGAR